MMQSQLKTLARMHGQFHNCKEEWFLSLLTWHQNIDNMVKSYSYRAACEKGFLAAKDVLPSAFAAESLPEIWQATINSALRNDTKTPTLCHSDVHIGNWAHIRKNGQMGLFDFQALSRSSNWRDVAYVLGTAMKPDAGRKVEREMVRYYISEYNNAGGPNVTEEEVRYIDIKCHSLGLPFLKAWTEISIELFTVLSYWTPVLTPGKKFVDMQPKAVSLEMIHRSTFSYHAHAARILTVTVGTMMHDHNSLGVARRLGLTKQSKL
jgi:hypothetical protein